MRKLLVVLAIVALVAPITRGEFFKVTGDGSFDTYRSGTGEGYSAGGGGTNVRIAKYNQAMGWLSFLGATADGSGASLSSVVASYGTHAKAYIYMRSAGTRMPAGTSGAYVISLRAGNQGAIVEDQGNGNGYSMMDVNGNSAIDPGYVGATELQAWRGCSPAPLATFTKFGDGIYTMESPTATGGVQGQPWITPSTRAAAGTAGRTPFKWGPNTAVQYDTGIMKDSAGTAPATGKYIGYFPDTVNGAGRSYYALEDVLGMSNNNSRSATTAEVVAAGQIMLGGANSPTLVNDSLYQNAADPRNNVVADWLVIPVDLAFLLDMANNTEAKGLVFANNFAGLAASYANPNFYTKEQNNASAPYLMVVPEPATMILLALGGLVALRRRSA